MQPRAEAKALLEWLGMGSAEAAADVGECPGTEGSLVSAVADLPPRSSISL